MYLKFEKMSDSDFLRLTGETQLRCKYGFYSSLSFCFGKSTILQYYHITPRLTYQLLDINFLRVFFFHQQVINFFGLYLPSKHSKCL